jgi:hypothetical protein
VTHHTPSASGHGAGDNPQVGHERTDWRVRPIIWSLVGLLVVGVIGHFTLWFLFTFVVNMGVRSDPVPPPLARTTPEPPAGPQLQVSPAQDWVTMRSQQSQLLNSYGWVDQGSGVVRIPIERAIEMTLERGLPVRSDPVAWPGPGVNEAHELESEGGQWRDTQENGE